MEGRQVKEGKDGLGETNRQYVEQREGDYYVVGSRVLLDGIVYCFMEGQSPESIAQSFPTLTLEEVYGAIAYYLGHQDEVESHLRRRDADFETRRQEARAKEPALYRKLDGARRAEAHLRK